MPGKDLQDCLIIPKWAMEDGPANDVALSTRARLARNVEGIPFPGHAQESDLKRVADLVVGAVYESGCQFRHGKLNRQLKVVRPSHLPSASHRFSLVDARIASSQHVSGGKHRLIVLDDGGSISLMVNEEDHLRIQCILPGFQPMMALQLAREFDSFLSRKISYAKADNYGYLTSSLANVGTGFRLSVMLHLVGLAYLGEVLPVLTAASELKVSIRGMLGEGTRALGDVFQVSNETTIGFTEREIASRIRAVAEHLISREREARRRLAVERSGELKEKVQHAWAQLVEARALTGEDAISYLSTLRLGHAIGLHPGISVKEFSELLVSMKLVPYALDGYAAVPHMVGTSDDVRRAKLIRDKLLKDDSGSKMTLH